MTMRFNPRTFLIATFAFLISGPAALWAQTSVPVFSSGADFRAPPKNVNGKSVGQEDVLIEEVTFGDSGRRYRRLDVGISGTLEGWVVKEGPRSNHFTAHPEFTFTQSGNEYRRFHGTLRYEASMGTSVTLVYPEAGTPWNKKLFMTVHGRSGSFKGGTLKAWNENLDPADPLGDLTGYEKAMLEIGYAVAKTRRNAGSDGSDSRLGQGDYATVLDDGEIVEGRNLNIHSDLLLDMVRLSRNLLEDRLGEKPVRTYWYGHSAGAMIGRVINFLPDLNRDENGAPLIDGFLHDDPGGGRYLPVLMKDGEDTLLMTDADRGQFMKSIATSHLLYTARHDIPTLPSWMSLGYLTNKRLGAKIFNEKGLGDKFRMYEIQGVSHAGGGESVERGDTVLLNLTGLMEGLIVLLDNWVEEDIAPPASKSDWLELGDADGDGVNENGSIALPEVACPLGQYFPFPPSRGNEAEGSTGFAAFDGTDVEPLDGQGSFVDMNLNRYLDQRESVDQAWHRLGLLERGESFSREKYQACVAANVAQLRQERLITERVAQRYIEQASQADFPGQ